MSGDALWYKDAIFYELRVRAFYDSDGDGIGDFRGLTEKLDYLTDLGVDTLWLLPFYPSPLKDDGYDISHYADVHPDVGTLHDFKTFVREAHRRRLRVVTELVLNHTSEQHEWFQRARRAAARSPHRDFYVWSDTPDRYGDARIIFKDFEHSNWTWDPVAKAYYWHRFYASQPDLNYDNPAVRRAMLRVLDFWFKLGVDGVRLDAVPYLFEREGTNCENLPETHEYLKALRRHVDERFRSRMLLAEANQWPEDAVAYFGEGDECHMAFHFPIMPRLFMALHMEDRFPIVDILEQTPPIAETTQWALFLRNHDELTLEMVTDEERDYMYRVYAADPAARINLGIRRRLAPLLGNDRRRMELMNGLLFALPGTPVLYYGDEIGMGDNFYLGDRNGVRTPMQWSGDRNAGFSRANPQRLYLPVIIDPEYHFETVNVEAQQHNPHSLLWWMKRLIALRRRLKAFGRGTLEFLHPQNAKVLAFVRRHGDEHVLVVANLSRFVQYVELDLSTYEGWTAVELFGGTPFPRIGELPYLLTLGPHAFYWFALVPERRGAADVRAGGELPALETRGSWDAALRGDGAVALEQVLPVYLAGRRWFGGKGRGIKTVRVADAVPLPRTQPVGYLTLLDVQYADGGTEAYVLPIGFLTGEEAGRFRERAPHALIARLTVRRDGEGVDGVLYDALSDARFTRALLDAVARQRRAPGPGGTVTGGRTRAFAALAREAGAPLEPEVLRAEQSNTSVVFGGRLLLKVFRRPDEGINPDLEIGRFLTETARFPHAAPLAGYLEYRANRREPLTLAVIHQYVPNEGDAWRFTLDEVERYFERALVEAHTGSGRPAPLPSGGVVEAAGVTPPEDAVRAIAGYLETARLLGQRTAEMHLALASDREDPAFAPESLSRLYQRALYQSMRNLTTRAFRTLDERRHALPAEIRTEADRVLALKPRVLRAFRNLTERKVGGQRIRCHGDYHLGQVLYTGRDFVIIDFEGEPARPLSERRLKRSPLGDVAGMLRSFEYAARTVLATRVVGRMVRPEDAPAFEPWTALWTRWVAASFLRGYLDIVSTSPLLPANRADLALLVDTFVLEKAVYELGYELNHRPHWAWIPLRGILELVAGGATADTE